MKKRTLLFTLPALLLSTVMSAESIFDSFQSPSNEYRPQVWWHWVDGNISKDGIKKDLVWLKGIGIGGVQNFDVGLGVKGIVPNTLPFMSEEWKEAFKYAVDTADSLGMDFGIHASGGWSDTGGPWVKVEDAMKTLKWKEFPVDGGRMIETLLPEPDSVCGKYLSHSFFSEHHPEYDYYRDIAVLAVKLPASDLSMEELGVTISTSDGSDGSALCDGDLNKVCRISPDGEGYAWVQFSFPKKTTIRSFFTGRKDNWENRSGRRWAVSNDGKCFRTVFDSIPEYEAIPFQTLDMPEARGRYFRFINGNKGEDLDFTELRVYPVTKINLGTEKAGFFTDTEVQNRFATPPFPDAPGTEDVMDISACCKDGVLRWQAPEGRWRIYRFGYSIRGRKNNPASEMARGLEIDKLDEGALSRYYRTYLDLFNEACGGAVGTKLTNLITDSYEAGCQTWTAAMPDEFRARRGYDLIPWLPVLTGQIIGSAQESERFLEDWRLTLSEMMVEHHYDALGPILKEYGLKRYSEFHESGRHFPVDGMDVKRGADVPTSAFWPDGQGRTYGYHLADIKESASVAHIYGQNTVAAESFSTDGQRLDTLGQKLAWDIFPDDLKTAADMAMAAGLNSFIFHSCIHQPEDDHIPGISLSRYGMWFQRNETWAKEAGPWVDYLTRSSYLLRQGRFVADIAYYISEYQNVTDRFRSERVPVPEGYSYDFVNKTALLTKDFNYKALVIDSEVNRMSDEVAEAIEALRSKGVLVVNGSLTAEALEAAGYRKDVEFLTENRENLAFIHRRLDDSELYWVASFSENPVSLEASFNVSGRKPYLMKAVDGSVSEMSYRNVDGRTVIPLDFLERDAFFILFKETVPEKSLSLPKPEVSIVTAVDGRWDVSFSSPLGSPEPISLETLKSLSESNIKEVKYFSGTSNYKKTVSLDSIDPSSRYILSLGEVHSLAHLRINGTDCGTLWKSPFEVDITGAIHKGDNIIEIEVTNGWANRLIGDCQPDEKNPRTWTSYRDYNADDPLHPSGLVGPVIIRRLK